MLWRWWDTTICTIRYNILSVAKRFYHYETIGSIFREVTKETVQLSKDQQIWVYLQEIVAELAQLFGLLDKRYNNEPAVSLGIAYSGFFKL